MYFDLAKINSMTKYPSILTYHKLGERGGLLDELLTPFPVGQEIIFTEKIDGTNVRLIFGPANELIIGSREELLWEHNDMIGNPTLGIVDYFRDKAKELRDRIAITQSFYVVYGELYGYKIGGQAKNYTTKNDVGFQIFDAVNIPDWEQISQWDLPKISSWRENGGQDFYHADFLPKIASELNVELAPMRAVVDAIPTTIEETYVWLKNFEESEVCFDSGKGESEGLVGRTLDRSVIAKIRFEDYEKTFRQMTARN